MSFLLATSPIPRRSSTIPKFVVPPVATIAKTEFIGWLDKTSLTAFALRRPSAEGSARTISTSITLAAAFKEECASLEATKESLPGI